MILSIVSHGRLFRQAVDPGGRRTDQPRLTFRRGNCLAADERPATIILSLVAIIITIITFNGSLTLLEAISALLASWGTYFLASKNNFRGWFSYS